MAVRWRAGAALLAAGVVTAACSLGRHQATASRDEDDPPAISADMLGEPDPGDTAWDALSPEERSALEREDLPRPFLDDAAPAKTPPASPAEQQGRLARLGDTIGKIGVAVASVGLTLAAFVAPFFIF
ncbi:MAG: hypothetical protein E6J71_05500 [Deltaproteobacteria bacterium]|nr:MAG: hypothetical protein E6J77_11325 [Deltaproteobacteria bacterium]TMB22639.1 MAG: hypothetical protein E6J71_05500 [Deltaproteobacteria bacterium]